MHNLVFFASGSGTNFQSVIDAVESGKIDARITALISNRDDAGAHSRAARHGIPSYTLDVTSPDFTQYLLDLLSDLNPDLIVLAGYLKKIPDEVIDAYRGKIVNIHPSLLPKYGGKGFYGMHVHRAVIESGDTKSGCTVHFVDEIYDNGSIIKQVEVPVEKNDTAESLAKKVLNEEHRLLPSVINQLLTQSTE